MSKIRSKNTKPEKLVRKALFARGYRFRLHDKSLPGKPDIVLPKYRTAIFIHGCFWHGHEGCKYFVVPKTRTDWWLSKIRRNKELDDIHKVSLGQNSWRVEEIYECDLKRATFESTIETLVTHLTII